MNKIIALGGKGMTGSYLPKEIPNYDLVDGFDITVPGVLEKIFKEEKPDVVILLAAVTNVVGAENDRARCYEVNSVAPFNVAKLCLENNARLIFISSVDVFDGEKKEPYTIYDEMHPIVVYGDSKMAAEILIQNVLPTRSLIIRAGWMFGGFEKDKKFVSYMMQQMKEKNPTIHAVNDIHGSPTYAKDLIDFVMMRAKDTDVTQHGIIQFCNANPATRYEQAKIIGEVMGYDGLILASTMKRFPDFRALKNSVMEASVKVRPWKEALTEYIKIWKERIR